jgi:3-ketosteroid 9alpha-monooxygenase subunit A
MVLQLSMRPTGWFHAGWSTEFPAGTAKPLRYFGEELAAFRTESGELHVLDAYCRHMGAHLGYESRVEQDCVVCPYHGWQWDGEGANRSIPYQDQPSRARTRSWPVVERHGLVYLWHDPDGGPPRADFAIPDVFRDFHDQPATEEDYFPCWPHGIVDKPDERIHPQLVLENPADCAHFQFTHTAAETPQMREFGSDGRQWWSTMDFISPRTGQPAMQVHVRNYGIGLTAALFDSKAFRYRLVLAATPIDEERSHLRVSYYFARNGAAGDELPPDTAAVAGSVEELFEQDARIWRHQAFVQKPVYAHADRAAYSDLRRWCEQFYETTDGQRLMPVLDDE